MVMCTRPLKCLVHAGVAASSENNCRRSKSEYQRLQVGCAEIVGRIVEDLKDESEPYRRMVMETIDKVVHELGSSDLDARLEELLIDGILYAFQEQASDDANVMLNGFGTVVNSLKMRAKPYLPQICGTIKWRLNNKGAKIRQQAADLIARIAVVMKVKQALGRLYDMYNCCDCLLQGTGLLHAPFTPTYTVAKL